MGRVDHEDASPAPQRVVQILVLKVAIALLVEFIDLRTELAPQSSQRVARALVLGVGAQRGLV